MTWKCPRCGTENDENSRSCHGMCGYVRFGKLVLAAGETGRDIKMNIDTAIGKLLLARVVGEESRYASEPQFYLNRCQTHEAWVIVQDPNATNPTRINGSVVSLEGAVLTSGDQLTIGDNKVPLKVRIEF